ncbi:MAG: fatty acid desaturase [Ketobacteraceae bacterium]|nr:fatty acid desaturase [Ketobacteraceae bacterium]
MAEPAAQTDLPEPKTPKKTGIWRHADGAVPNTLAFAYVALAQAAGILLMTTGSPLTWLPGVLLTAHSLVIAGYLIHDVAHRSIFRSRELTERVGEILSWICGAAYAPFKRIQLMHMRHHGDRADLALFDPRDFLKTAPAWFRKLIYGLEWCYIPAVELVMHYHVVLRPFFNKAFAHERRRVLFVGATRLLFFAFLWTLSPWALVGYAIAYMLFLTALFIADAFAHTYEFYLIEQASQPVPREGRDAAYDREHTYSNVISERWPWLNLLNLNFGYHTAHHDQPGMPWHRLPQLHAKTYAPDAPQILPYRELWRSFHKNRLVRIEAEDAGDIGTGPGRADHFLGVHGVSFLSIV